MNEGAANSPGPLVTIHKRRNLPGGKVEARPLYHCRKFCPWYEPDGWNQCANRDRANPAYCADRTAQAEALASLARELDGMARDMRAAILAEARRAEEERQLSLWGEQEAARIATGADHAGTEPGAAIDGTPRTGRAESSEGRPHGRGEVLTGN